jgi:hypothetical protein
MPPRKRSGPATGPLREVPPASVTTRIVPDPYGIRWAARERLADQHRRLRHARLAEQAMSLVAYYTRPWWWAA